MTTDLKNKLATRTRKLPTELHKMSAEFVKKSGINEDLCLNMRNKSFKIGPTEIAEDGSKKLAQFIGLHLKKAIGHPYKPIK
jgi:hypothetical protein